MPLTPGTRLGPYEILTLIGAGGMGKVYKANDTRLDRIVAVKVSNEQFSDRFEREARAVAGLNHSNICTLHDVGPNYLVMEYIEGTPLKGPLPFKQALRYAVQICAALVAAHRNGITHRDLKPANILVTKTGVKLLDFGLAKTGRAGGPPSDATASVTLTGNHEIVGTLHYMSPEQLLGKDVDARSDIFSFGVVLYEMLTGSKAFDGESSASVMAKILEREPSEVTDMPRALAHVLRRCLAKDPELRWQSAQDLQMELDWIAEDGPTTLVASPPTGLSRREALAWGASAVFGAAAVTAVTRQFRAAPPAADRVRFTIADMPPSIVVNRFDSLPAISPNGRMVAMVAVALGRSENIWIRALDSTELRGLPGTEDAGSLFWSPDSRWLGFFADKQLKRISPAGGPATTICDTPIGSGATWNKQDVIVFQRDRDGALYQVPASGGDPAPATVLADGQPGHLFPTFLPDGRTFLFSVLRGPREQRGIFAAMLGSAKARRISPLASNVRFAPSGHLLFSEGTKLLAQPFDAGSLSLKSEATAVAGNLYTYEGAGAFDISTTGTLVYAEVENLVSQLMWFDRSGRPQGTVGPKGPFVHMDLSRDEKRVLVERYDGQVGDLWVIDTARGIPTPVASDPGNWLWEAFWSPDGSQFVYALTTGRPTAIYRKNMATPGLGERLRVSPMVPAPPTDWSPDGKYIVFQQFNQNGVCDIGVLDASSQASGAELPSIQYLSAPYALGQGRISPDGRWMAYGWSETNSNEIFVSPFPRATAKWRISRDGGAQPRWRADGKVLFYVAPDRTLMAAPIPSSPDQAGAPIPLFRSDAVGAMFSRFDYAPSADGRRFLVNTRVGEAAPQTVQVLVGWRP